MKAWYFSGTDKKLRYGDDRIIQAGKMHTVSGTPRLCHYGLHGSKRIINALDYAPGPYIWRVDITRSIDEGVDKLCGQRRKYLWGFDASDILFEFSRKQALINIEKIKPHTDKYDLIVDYLSTGNPLIRSAARSAAESAVRSAAWSAARSAAESAVRSAAEAAARSAAESAAWSAVRSAAWSAAWSAVRSAARSAAESAAWSAVRSAARSAAESAAWSAVRSAAWSAAESAAWSAANTELEILIFNEARRLNLVKE